MDCRECSNLLYDYLDNELDIEEERKMESHLSACVVCQSEWREIQEAMALYRSHITAELPSAGFAERVMVRLADDKLGSAVSAPLAVLGVLLLALFAGGLFFLLPLLYPVFRVLVELTVHLLPVPAIMLTAFPVMQFTSIALLAAALVTVTWATRRAILY